MTLYQLTVILLSFHLPSNDRHFTPCQLDTFNFRTRSNIIEPRHQERYPLDLSLFKFPAPRNPDLNPDNPTTLPNPNPNQSVVSTMASPPKGSCDALTCGTTATHRVRDVHDYYHDYCCHHYEEYMDEIMDALRSYKRHFENLESFQKERQRKRHRAVRMQTPELKALRDARRADPSDDSDDYDDEPRQTQRRPKITN